MNSNKKRNIIEIDSFKIIRGLVVDILGRQAENIDLTPDTKFIDIGFDSIKFIRLLLELEDVTHVSIETIAMEIDLSSIQSINDVSHLLDKLNKQKKS